MRFFVLSSLLLAACGTPAPTQDAATQDVTRSDAPASDGAAPSALCQEYCALAQAHCTGADQLYATSSACQTACAAFPVTGMRGDMSGDTIYCRLYHVDTPASTNPALHCPHAGPSGGGVCD